MKPFIGIKKIWYGAPMTTAPTAKGLAALLASDAYTEVKNSHEGSWSYTQDDPSVTDYINELTGVPYYRDMTSAGNKTINFTIGVYAFEDKVALQGGSLIKEKVGSGQTEEVVGWSSPENPELFYKSIVAMTKTGNYIVFTNAGIVAKGNAVEKNIGLGVTAVAMDNQNAGVADEYLFDGEKVAAGTAQTNEE